jgi:hypothetical protein
LFSTSGIPIVNWGANARSKSPAHITNVSRNPWHPLGQPETSLCFPVIHKMKISLAESDIYLYRKPTLLPELKPIGQWEKAKANT